ncbi:hypothetical protein [Vibrio parahaemolyticus]|uniref:hypothetical protein n=1 Tax=Vibrio parahaemolyticus TaxID=670 RepID=UPI002B1F4EF1|nr:hypothetical protein [Vibrio parahaemolyticus]MEA5184989.1 hypothetical protein [Vibrio parahaemolyticus]HAV1353706.1 hypothetical protein [Vibrio parahaemolyticus]
MKVKHFLPLIFMALCFYGGFHLMLRYDYRPQEVVRIIETDCSHGYWEGGVGGRAKAIVSCHAKVIPINTNSTLEVLSNCPFFTQGWEVVLFSSQNYFTGHKRFWLNCRPYIDLPKPFKAPYKLNELNELFANELNEIP